MNKVIVTTQRFLQNIYPFQGKIVFTLKGDNSELVTSFIPEFAIFSNGMACVKLVPNSEIEDAVTYYHYALYPQGHDFGRYLTDPVEEGDCIVPVHDCNLDDIISPIPDQKSAEEIIAKASQWIAQIQAALEDARNCAYRACECASQANQDAGQVASFTQEVQQWYTYTKEKAEQTQRIISDFQAYLEQFDTNVRQEIDHLFENKINTLMDYIHDEELLIKDLWDKIREVFGSIESLQNLITLVQEIQEEVQNIEHQISTELVTLDTDQTITGEKTFTVSPVIPNPPVDSRENIPATTEWVADKIDQATENVVHLCGDKVAISQLPSSASTGDTWFIPSKQTFYVYYDGNWHGISIKRQADTIQAAPQNDIELAVLTAAIEEGGHLTLILNN